MTDAINLFKEEYNEVRASRPDFKSGDTIKTIRFGQQGVSGAGKSPKTASEKARKKSFKARHASNISKGKMSAAYWSDKVKW